VCYHVYFQTHHECLQLFKLVKWRRRSKVNCNGSSLPYVNTFWLKCCFLPGATESREYQLSSSCAWCSSSSSYSPDDSLFLFFTRWDESFNNFFDNVDNFLQLFWKLFENFLTTFWQLFDNFWQLFDSFITTFCQLFDNFFDNFFDPFYFDCASQL
jgi:hypothetical protein